MTISPGASGGGGFSPVYQVGGNCESGGATCTITLSVTAGWFAVCGVGSTTLLNTFSCTDASSDTLTATPSGSPYTDPTFTQGALFEGSLGTTTSEVFTCHVTVTTNFMDCVVAVYSGTPTSGWDVTVAGANNTFGAGTNAWTSGTSGTTANASELGIGLFVTTNGGGGPSWTGTNGWTFRVQDATVGAINTVLIDKVLSSTGAQTATANASIGAASGLGMVSTIK